MKMLKLIIPVLGTVVMTGCELNQKDIGPDDSFIKIYNHPDELYAFYPESVLELNDGGYLILSALKDDSSQFEFPVTHLVRTNDRGEVVYTREHNWYAPVGKLIQDDNSAWFVAMDNQLRGFGLEIDLASGNLVAQQELDLTMPLSAFRGSGGNILVLGYNFLERKSRISLFTDGFNRIRTVDLNINSDLQNQVQKHLNRSGTWYPFYMGEYSGTGGEGYYVNCFANYTLRTIFLDAAGNYLNGDIYSFQTEAALSSLVNISDNRFALTRYYAGSNYLLPLVEVEYNRSQNFNDVRGEVLPELTFNARVLSGKLILNDLPYLIFASQSNSNSMVIYIYEPESGKRVASIHRDFDTRIDVSDLKINSDGNILVLGKTFILGKYQRPVLVKVNSREIKDLLEK